MMRRHRERSHVRVMVGLGPTIQGSADSGAELVAPTAPRLTATTRGGLDPRAEPEDDEGGVGVQWLGTTGGP